MAGSFEGTAHIDRPIEQVFAFLADGENDPKFMGFRSPPKRAITNWSAIHTKEEQVAQTKADRQAAAKKAAATRKRNQIRDKAQSRGTKAASSRRRNEAKDSLSQAKSAASGAASRLGSAGKAAGDAATSAGKSVAGRARGKR